MLERTGTTRRLIAIFVAFYVLATIVLGIGAYLLSDHELSGQLEDSVAAEVSLLRHIHAQDGLGELKAALRRRDDRGVNRLGYLLIDPAGRRVGGELNMPQQSPGWHTAQIGDFDGDEFVARMLTVRLRDGSALTVAAETDPVDRLRQTMVWLFAAGVAVMIAGGLGGAYLLSRQLRRNLDRMNDTALAIIRGDMTKRVPIGPGDDEFDRLADTLNRMLDRNAALIENLRRVSSAIAHDLRTPIAHLAQELERALASRPNVAAMERQIEAAIAQSAEILSLFSAMLRISEVESGSLRRYFEPFDISATVRRICESYQAVAEDSGQAIQAEIAEGLTLVGDLELVAQALVNLLENALQHSGHGTLITVVLAREADQIVMVVRDDGRGVPEELIPSLTDRFVRGDRARNSPGFGLGLNLVAAIAGMHDARLVLGNRQPGFEARIAFPAKA